MDEKIDEHHTIGKRARQKRVKEKENVREWERGVGSNEKG